MARPYLGGTTGGYKEVTASETLSKSDSGKIILLSVNDKHITMPSPDKGLHYTVIQAADYSSAVCTIIQGAASEDFYGHVFSSDLDAGADADTGAAANTKIVFQSPSLRGDSVDLYGLGTVWHVRCFSKIHNGITLEN